MFYLPTHFFHGVVVLARFVSATIWTSSVIRAIIITDDVHIVAETRLAKTRTL
jgi:hypothetical protein